MARSGDVCIAPGLYASDCACHADAIVQREETFPRCPGCHKEVGWRLVRTVETDPARRPPPWPGGEPPAPAPPPPPIGPHGL